MSSSDSDGAHSSKRAKKSKKEPKKESKKSHKKERKTIPSTLLSPEDDYFLRAREFKHWLHTRRGTPFDALTAKESRKLFEKFCRHWNEGKLDSEFYTGLPEEAKSSSFTSHKWAFAKKLSSRDSQVLESAKDSVHVATHAGDSKKRGRDGGSGYQGAAASKVQEAQERERVAMEAFRRKMGLESGQRIQIAPRPESESK